jgi:hypothetical protein
MRSVSSMLALAALALWLPNPALAVCEGLGGDPDGDSICSDGDASGTAGDAPCSCGPLDPPSCHQSCDDNCPFTSNPDQLDQGGFSTSAADGIGDVCQCGDVSDDASVNILDVVLRRHDLQSQAPGLAAPEKCRVTGSAECACDPGDVDLIRSALTQGSPDLSSWTCSSLRACYSGPGGTAGVGTCRSGLQGCIADAWGPCSGEIIPGGEACNLEDDDCDGQLDEGLTPLTCGVGACESVTAACSAGVEGVCIPATPSPEMCGDGIDNDCDGIVDGDNACGCIYVAPGGNDLSGDGSTALPVLTISHAIALAAMPAAPKRVCVARGAACSQSTTYLGAFTMADGIDVLGGYESAGWTRCGFSSPTWVQPGTADGVVFPASVTTPTQLDGFRIERASTATTAGVTIDGGNAVLSNLIIYDQPTATTSYGVRLINGGQALIRSSQISGGNGSSLSVGVSSDGSTVTLRDNCPSGGKDSAGRCTGYCDPSATVPTIRGRAFGSSAESDAVLLQDSPGAIVESSLICGGSGTTGVGIRAQGASDGMVIRSSTVRANFGGTTSRGLWLEDCGGASPWIVDNAIVEAGAGSLAEAIHAIGDCHPVIDSNVEITGQTEGPTAVQAAVCSANASAVPSHCSLLDNLSIQATNLTLGEIAVGVRCDDGSCNRVAGNVVVGGQGTEVFGLILDATGSFVERNEIHGGCGVSTTTGVRSESAYARLENNLIFAGACTFSTSGTFTGLDVLINGDEASALDVHSNVIDAGGNATCTGSALRLSSGVGPWSGGGRFRNNIFRAGQCSGRYGVFETSSSADPIRFSHNDLDPTGAPTALYRDENLVNLGTAALVNALTDMTTGGNISADPLFVGASDFHLSAGSMCIDAGTHEGAPAVDFEGQARDALPDIGVDEL